MKFYRADFHTVMSGLVVRYRVMGDDSAMGFEISASRDGALIHGGALRASSYAAADAIHAVIQRAVQHSSVLMQQHRQCALGFDGEPDCVVEQRKYRVFSDEYEVIASRTAEGVTGAVHD